MENWKEEKVTLLPRRLFLRLAALALAAVLYSVVFGATDALVGIFNSENSVRMAQFAHMGMRLYFIGYFFAGFNIVAAGYLSSTDRPAEASITSICRGMAAIVVCSLVLSRLFGMNGVWAAFPVSELLTALLTKALGRKFWSLCVAMVVGCAACYVLGTIWFMILTGADLVSALGWCVLPYLPGDAVKIVLAAVLTMQLDKRLKGSLV